MDPNSRNQLWSKWVFTVKPGGQKYPPFLVVKHNASRFGRLQFGSASQMLVSQGERGVIHLAIRSEGHPVHDPSYVNWMMTIWQQWAIAGWGNGTTVTCETKLEAGSRQDGTPPDQLIIGPPPYLCPRFFPSGEK